MQAALIGLGTMGPGIAATLARSGMTVRVTDTNEQALARAPAAIAEAWRVLDQLDTPPQDNSDPNSNDQDSRAAVTVHATLAEAVSGAELVIENVSERLEIKQAVFTELEQHVTADCILASDTSGIPISDLQQGLQHPARVVGMHWSNPPHIIPMIEVIAGAQTDPEVVTATAEIIRSLGLLPVVVKKDVPGFVENRILYAIMREAVDLVEQGVIEPEALDACVSWGIGYKLSVIGPMALLDMAGLDIYQAVAGYLNQNLCNRADVSPWIKARTEAGQLGLKSGAGVYQYTTEQVGELRAERAQRLVAVRHALASKLNTETGQE